MSATNETSTIGLSQYISTDKPTYLVDYNGDMLKIDGAIAADRESIGDVNTVAQRADGKADTNKGSIDTLNEQINGDPDVPSDTGLAGKVNTIDGSVNTINSLIGNGTPTTSDQTIIGAINALEGAIAPREDAADLANSYVIGEQFARGGSLYTALTPLSAGTAFASLTLNTDYKNSDTLVEQIAGAVTIIENKIGAIVEENGLTLTAEADGTKTYAQLLVELRDAFISYCQALPDNEFAKPTAIDDSALGIFTIVKLSARFNNTIVAGTYLGTFFNTRSTATYVQLGEVNLGAPSGMRTNTWTIGTSTDWTLDELSNDVAPANIQLIVNKYKINS